MPLRPFQLLLAVGLGGLACGLRSADSLSGPETQTTPELVRFPSIVNDAAGARLQGSFIWTGKNSNIKGETVAFRKTFALTTPPATALLRLFADVRYVLWVNGRYLDRGPSRFQPNGPTYDSIDLAPHLRAGENVLAILVVGNLSGGKAMRHAPGLSAVLDLEGKPALSTDASWRWSATTRFRKVVATWPNLGETEVDARVEVGDWTAPGFDDATWSRAVPIDGAAWGPLTASPLPRLRETPVPVHLPEDVQLPVTLTAGQSLRFSTGRLVQAYPVIEFTATDDTEFRLAPFNLTYRAKNGAQSHFTLDTRGFAEGSIKVESGTLTVTSLTLIERLYPFDRLGSFRSNDESLNRLWTLSARSCELLSEDAYVDCADRERVEWMDNSPPGFEVTRTAFAAPGPDGKPVLGDPRLLGALLRRTALTLQPEGWVKAHTCSDRYDIHALMEDRACAWIEGARAYLEATGDHALIREIWPAVAAQMDYFLRLRTPRGLVRARDWVVWGNPVSYIAGEGATLNAFVARALRDASWLARQIGLQDASTRWQDAGDQLAAAINRELWNEDAGTYWSGRFTDADLAESKAKWTLGKGVPARTGELSAPTLHATLFCLERGIVPPERRARVLQALFAQETGTPLRVMLSYYLAKVFYELDRPELDTRVLSLFRQKWQGMVASPWQCTWEEFGGGSKAHIYGMFPGYLLSAYVLGVRRDETVAERKIVIEPHLGDLTSASGDVVTEFGVVTVSWTRTSSALQFEVVVPPQVNALLRLPGSGPATVEGRAAGAWRAGRTEITLPTGISRGIIPQNERTILHAPAL